jgi:hypothetical protein
MKALTCEVVLSSASTRADGSLGLRLATPELSPSEKTAIFELQGHPLKMLLQPMGQAECLVWVKSELDTKTPSQRLRGVLFILWKQIEDTNKDTFEVFYAQRMESIIEKVKERLKPE